VLAIDDFGTVRARPGYASLYTDVARTATIKTELRGSPAGGAKLPGGWGATPVRAYRLRRLGGLDVMPAAAGPLTAFNDASSKNEKHPPGFQPPVSMKWTLPSTFG